MTTVPIRPSLDELESRLEARKAQLRDLATMGAVVTSILEIDAVLSTDVRAAMTGDPAAKGHDEIIFSYPGLLAIFVYLLYLILQLLLHRQSHIQGHRVHRFHHKHSTASSMPSPGML